MIELAVHQQIYASWVLLGAHDWTEADRDKLFGLLAKHSLSLMDLPQTFLAVGVAAAPSRPKDKIYERLWRMFGQFASDNSNVRTTTRKKLDAFLAKHDLSWAGPNGFTAILLSYWADHNTPSSATTGTATDFVPDVNALDLIQYLIDEHTVITPVQRIVFALWSLGTHVYDLFEKFPLLGAIGAASSMGKSTLLMLLKQFCSEPHLSKNTTPAAIYRRLDITPRQPTCWTKPRTRTCLSTASCGQC